ncbi:reticulon-like protein B22 isoform X3 [Prosopis cineraria]|uniref:reticulon-like protein B22 isoform X3 n=2 Tax=Prosopis cineraria TaxID=364024 RepID=UPI00240ECF68|nr:reticulon-like protein B22 isoform X3 [Prosopis cineraria]
MKIEQGVQRKTCGEGTFADFQLPLRGHATREISVLVARIMECTRGEVGKPMMLLLCGTLVYYHCAYRNSSIVSLVSDVFIVLLCSLAILGLLFRQLNISVPVDPLEWQITQDTANGIVAWLVNTIGAAESVFRVAATGHDKRLFLKVILCLYVLSALGRLALGATVAYAGRTMLILSLYVHGVLSFYQLICGLVLGKKKRPRWRTRHNVAY